MSAPASLFGADADYRAFRLRAAARDAGPELLAALERMMPTGICLTNRNIPDSTTIPIEATVTMGELRAIAALIAKAKGGAA